MDKKQQLKRARDWSVVTLLTFLFANIGLFQAWFNRLPKGQLLVGREFIMLYLATVVMSVAFWGVLEFVFKIEGPITLFRNACGNPPTSSTGPSIGNP